MNKKKILAVALSTAMLGCCFTSCDLLSNDTKRDMDQVVAEIDITKAEEFKTGGKYAEYAESEVIKPLTVTKRELVSYFINSGYSYISSGMSYEDTFNNLLNSMVNYKILVQYSMVYLFENNAEYTVDGYKSYVGNAEGDEYSVKSLEYFLQDKPFDTFTRAEKAQYALKTSINSAIDSQENNYIASVDDKTSESEGEDRATPEGIDTEKEEYFDGEYDIYTGFNALTACGSYEKVTGGSATTRQKAYHSFLKTLKRNGLLADDEVKAASEGKLSELDYYTTELISQYQSALSEKLTDTFEEEAAAVVSDDYLAGKFNELFDSQKETYDKSTSSFETDIGSLSDSSFVLYCPESELADETDNTQYGFVYNILLPFSSVQSYTLKQYQNDTGLTDSQRYEKRADLLEKIEATDQRETWFNGATDYSYVSDEAWTGGVEKSNYLFFEDTMTKSDRYETLEKYYGYYPYNGTVEYDYDNYEYTLEPNKLSITAFLTEMEAYMNYALETEGYTNKAAALTDYTYSLLEKNVTTDSNGYATTYGGNGYLDDDGNVDYSKFVYYMGQVGGLEVNAKTMFEPEDNPAYTAMSAFNELQFAYSTDPGCLNTYMGYNVSRYTTSYVGEFEYAAKLAIALGAGTYTVCPSDYGWHIIYCTYAFDQSDVYGKDSLDWTKENIENKGTFEYYFYEAVKGNLTSNYQNILQSQAVNAYNNEGCVKTYKERYADYTSLKNTMSSASDAQ